VSEASGRWAAAFRELREVAGPDLWGDDPVAAIRMFRGGGESAVRMPGDTDPPPPGPVVTYPLWEEARPRPGVRDGDEPRLVVGARAIWVSRAALRLVGSSLRRVHVEFNRAQHLLRLRPADDGPWRSKREGTFGGGALVRWLEQRGVRRGRYPCRLVNGALVADVNEAQSYVERGRDQRNGA
jgi:hypothetical protein